MGHVRISPSEENRVMALGLVPFDSEECVKMLNQTEK